VGLGSRQLGVGIWTGLLLGAVIGAGIMFVLTAPGPSERVASLRPVAPSAVAPWPSRKLVEYGTDVLYPDQVRARIRQMETKPFDGVIFRLREWNHAFDTRSWDEAALKPQFDDLAAIDWRTFRSNFLCLYAANKWKLDWYNDEQWRQIARNMRLVSKAARLGRCDGIVFDTEPYGLSPWLWLGVHDGHSFPEAEAQVFERGKQFIAALQSEMPTLRLMTFFHNSLYEPLLEVADPDVRRLRLALHDYALMAAFMNGMMAGAAPGVRIIDGYELAYYHTSSEHFYQAYHVIKQRSLAWVPPALHQKYATNFQAGMSVYMDQLLALRQPPERPISNVMSPEERLRLLEFNTYYAMLVSDEYTWCYGERLNWWNESLPEGAEAAIRRARAKVLSGQPLGFDVAESVAAAKRRMVQ
jgi:hypothetical protein